MVSAFSLYHDRVVVFPQDSPVAIGTERWIVTHSFGRPELPFVIWKELWSGLRIRTFFTEHDVHHISFPEGSAIAYLEDIIDAFQKADRLEAARLLTEIYKEGTLYIFSRGEYSYEEDIPHC